MKVSIITVCKNAQDTIEQTIRSVISQNYKNIEYLVIDGKSTDKTMDIVNRYKDKIDVIVSERDGGIYYAMNKGVEKSSGDVIYFLNSGDFLFDERIVSDIVNEFKKTNSDIIYGDALLYYENYPKRLILKRHININRLYLARDGIYHQAMFVKKDLFVKYGGFDTRFKLSADYEWTLRVLVRNNATTDRINKIIVKYLLGGACSNNKETLKERYQILPLYFSLFEVFFIGLLYWFIYHAVIKIKRECFRLGYY